METNLGDVEPSPISATFDDFHGADIASVFEMPGGDGHARKQAFEQSFTGCDTHCGIDISSVTPLGFGELRS